MAFEVFRQEMPTPAIQEGKRVYRYGLEIGVM